MLYLVTFTDGSSGIFTQTQLYAMLDEDWGIPDQIAHYERYYEPEPEPEPETFHLNIYIPSWAAGGYVEPGSGDYPVNTTVRLRAYPNSGYQFTGWGGDASGTGTTYNLLMDRDKNVEAYFELVPVGWVNVDSVTITVTLRTGVSGWALLDEKIITVTLRPEVLGWALLAVETIDVKVIGVPPPNGEPPTEEKEFPWLPVALIGSGVALAAVSLLPKKTKA